MELLVPWCKPTCPSQRFGLPENCECDGFKRERLKRRDREIAKGFDKQNIQILGIIPPLPKRDKNE